MSWDGDKPLPEDDLIKAAHPMRTGRHDLYEEAMRLVGAKHSKGALVELVNWLLARIDDKWPDEPVCDDASPTRLRSVTVREQKGKR